MNILSYKVSTKRGQGQFKFGRLRVRGERVLPAHRGWLARRWAAATSARNGHPGPLCHRWRPQRVGETDVCSHRWGCLRRAHGSRSPRDGSHPV